MKPKVLVLMATFNGEKYLREQIDSILKQKDVDVYLQIADDCSTDNTINIIKEYCKNYKNISYSINKKNKGFTYNFIDLIFNASKDYDYYALSDQDDVWLENKLIAAINKIKDSKHKNGCLYSSNLTVVDENLNKLYMQENKSALKIKRYSYLVNNIVTGCTVVFNNRFLNHLLKHYPKDIYLHDYWLCLVSIYTASFYYDINSYIFYRQHKDNLIGTNRNKSFWNKLSRAKKEACKTSNLVQKLYFNFKEDIQKDDLKYIKLAAFYRISIKDKIKLLLSYKIRKRKYNIFFIVKVLFNLY